MIRRESCFILAAAIIIMLTFRTANIQASFSIEISTSEKELEYGSPIVVSMRMLFSKPQMLHGKKRQVIPLSKINLWVKDYNTEQKCIYRLPRTKVYLHGMEYIGKVIVWCEVYEERRKLRKRIMLPESGKYCLEIDIDGTRSNVIDVEVNLSKSGKSAMSFLTDSNDCAFILGGVLRRPEGDKNLEMVVDQFKDTVLAHWCAARLGVEYFKDFHERHQSFDNFNSLFKKGKIEDPLFEKAYKYLNFANELPDEFGIREEVLYRLITMEWIKGNYETASSLLDELGVKYADGEYGKRAENAKKKIKALIGQNKTMDTVQLETNQQFSKVITVICTIVAIAFLYVLALLRKKKYYNSTT
jgi:hypothetical protein